MRISDWSSDVCSSDLVKQEAMSTDLFRQRQLCAHQEGGPINGVKTDNILDDDMKDITAFTPEVPVLRGVIGITKTSQIIGERIDQYIHAMACSAGPLATRFEAGSADEMGSTAWRKRG